MNRLSRIIFGIILVVIGIIALQRINKINIPTFSNFFEKFKLPQQLPSIENQSIVYEESVIIDVVDKSLPSVVTIGISTTRTSDSLEIDPFDPFGPFRRTPGEERKIEQNIGSGFIVSSDGLIITNKHVVSETDAEYKVLTNDKKEYKVEKIYRDGLNDLAIIKINANNLKPLALGDSTKLKLGQMAIAIGTPLGEFQNTVTQGIISGLGRGITAGSPFEGFVEKLDNVIQTDAAISPGNSGGPLLNSKAQAVGVNTAIAAEGQNIGFAIPINIVKDLIETFNKNGGTFERPYIGVRYQMIDRRAALLNELPEGAYVEEVIEGSPADDAGIVENDIITHFDGSRLTGSDDQALAKTILNKKIGDTVEAKIWRDGEILTVNLTLEASNQ